VSVLAVPRARPEPPAGRVEVVVSSFALDLPEAELARLEATLSPDERARAARYRHHRDATRFVAARGGLRERLGALLGSSASAIRFGYGDHGKPWLPDAPELSFNLAHTDGLALLATTARAAALGIDVESLDAGFGGEEIARQFFSSGEVATLLALEPEERDAAFRRCWTRKEAYIKAVGDGLYMPLDDFAVAFGPGEPARLTWCRDAGEVQRWSLHDVSDMVPGYVAAVAVDSPASVALRPGANNPEVPE
jgi:4'-phosphopantetheinyl transferase